jgi:type VI secretion system protein ImpF
LPKPDPAQPLLPALFDRLIVNAAGDSERSHFQHLRDLRQSVRRDLEFLLNTRRRCKPISTVPGALEQSLVTYGMPDFAAAGLSAQTAAAAICREIQQTIERFEPRLSHVHVIAVDSDEPMDRRLRFRIEAMLRVEPDPEPVVFDSALDPSATSFEVNTARP